MTTPNRVPAQAATPTTQPAPKPTPQPTPATGGSAPPMRFKAKAASSGPMPDGTFYTVFTTTESVPAREWEGKQLEEGVRWVFEVTHGPHKGRRLSTTTGPVPTEKNACGRILAGLFGRPITPGEDIDIEPFLSMTFIVTVQGGKIVNVAVPPDVNV